MAEQVNILQLNNGIPANNPVNGYLYIVIDGKDYFISYEDLVKYQLVKNKVRAGTINLIEGDNLITFKQDEEDSPLSNDQYAVIIYPNDGIDISNKTASGFSVNSLQARTLNYIAILNT